jgi:hypothetical protein
MQDPLREPRTRLATLYAQTGSPQPQRELFADTFTSEDDAKDSDSVRGEPVEPRPSQESERD